MDAGAHGGQVVCELGTALKVLQEWGVAEELKEGSDASLPEVPEAAQQPASASNSASSRRAGPGPSELCVMQRADGCSSGDQAGARPQQRLHSPSSPGGGSAASTGIAGSHPQVPSTPAKQPSPFHAPPAKLAPEAVEVRRLGLFKFKGSPEPVELVHLQLAALAARSFPADPPKGKGARLEAREGLLASGRATLPPVPQALVKLSELVQHSQVSSRQLSFGALAGLRSISSSALRQLQVRQLRRAASLQPRPDAPGASISSLQPPDQRASASATGLKLP
jgi:hypothetical protein